MSEIKQEYLDITSKQDNMSFKERIAFMESIPNRIEKYIYPKSYLEETEIKPTINTVFDFVFHNIKSQMYLVSNLDIGGKVYSFTWLSKDHLFYPDMYEVMSFDVTDNGVNISCDFRNINTKDYDIPDLKIGDKTYTNSQVPMLLGLSMMNYLGLNKCMLTDVSFVIVPYITELIRENRHLSLLDERTMMGKGSIYEKYGFKLDRQENKISEITLQNILDDYKIRIENRVNFFETLKNEDPSYWLYYSHLPGCRISCILAEDLIKMIEKEENKNITIKTWLESGNMKQKSILLLSLTNNLISWKSKNTNSPYYVEKLRFYEEFIKQSGTEMYNPNIAAGIKEFLSK